MYKLYKHKIILINSILIESYNLKKKITKNTLINYESLCLLNLPQFSS